MRGISVSYSGVHQAFQIALAAQELGVLDRFYCSLLDAPGKWGRFVSWFSGEQALVNRRCLLLNKDKVTEFPWPALFRRAAGKHGFLRRRFGLLEANSWFDRTVARKLANSDSQIFVGVETCAEKSLAVATGRGMIRVLDCPQWHPAALKTVLEEGARRASLQSPRPLDTPAMAVRKEREFASADWLLVYSDAHRRSFEKASIPTTQLFQCPLWVDQTLWHPAVPSVSISTPLRVIFAGSVNLRKGVFFLLEAVKRCAKPIELTLAGAVDEEGREILRKPRVPYRAIGVQTKGALRRLYAEHDVLVLPSLADSFGFVALEAMACGLPVIVTDNCGVPVPDPTWRVPIMNSDAIAQRLEYYADDREALKRDGLLAQQFARQFTPERYREQIKNLFRRILGDMNGKGRVTSDQ